MLGRPSDPVRQSHNSAPVGCSQPRLRCAQVAALCIFAGFLALLAATIAAGMLALALLRSPRNGDEAASTAVCLVTLHRAFRL